MEQIKTRLIKTRQIKKKKKVVTRKREISLPSFAIEK